MIFHQTVLPVIGSSRNRFAKCLLLTYYTKHGRVAVLDSMAG